MTKDYRKFLDDKTQLDGEFGFKPLWMPDKAYDFQKFLIDWTVRKGRSALLTDCGTGKAMMGLSWAENVVRKTNGRVLVLTPLAVSLPTKEEGDKFGIDAEVSRDGKFTKKIVITNYERLHYFDWKDFDGALCDEAGILKNYAGETKAAITEFMRKLKFRQLCTATPAPNDYIELGTSSEALGNLGYIDMLKTFFKADNNTYAQGGGGSGVAKRFNKDHYQGKFRFRGHAEEQFWRWVCSWARAMRKPSDLGFSDDGFNLPQLIVEQHLVKAERPLDGMLFPMPAHGLKEERSERRVTLQERCEKSAELCKRHDCSVAWCNLNPEGDLLEKMIEDSVQVAGKESIEEKEEKLEAFRNRKSGAKNLISKVVVAGFGSNWQFCAHQTYFPDHSYEKYYQGVRRSWRHGQERDVLVDVIAGEGEANALKNLQRKTANAERMFNQLVKYMADELKLTKANPFKRKEQTPSWL